MWQEHSRTLRLQTAHARALGSLKWLHRQTPRVRLGLIWDNGIENGNHIYVCRVYIGLYWGFRALASGNQESSGVSICLYLFTARSLSGRGLGLDLCNSGGVIIAFQPGIFLSL